uniref:Metaxin n=1 Tax=Physcomitrium patens TaxID=3218 RepID=A0A7I4DHR1_PHYPA
MESSGDSVDLVLVTRPAGFGMPTVCPACLPVYLYLRLAAVSFREQVSAVEPDSVDLPCVEYGENVGFSSENGGVIEFLRKEKIADLDADLSDSEKAELETCKAMMESWVADASAFEVWTRDNDRQCKVVYFSELPWGLVQALDWKQRLAVMQRLGITPENTVARSEELFRKASNAYSALSVLLSDRKFFFNNRPTSLDALVLGHLIFHLRVPFEISTLKGEILKYQNLVDYAESWGKQLLDKQAILANPAFRPKAPPSPPLRPTKLGSNEREEPAKKARRYEVDDEDLDVDDD